MPVASWNWPKRNVDHKGSRHDRSHRRRREQSATQPPPMATISKPSATIRLRNGAIAASAAQARRVGLCSRSSHNKDRGIAMSRFSRWAATAALVIIGCDSAIAQTACDRACLGGVLDKYLAAVIAHDRSKAPLAVGFRQTENAINAAPGKGVWQSVTGLGKVQRRYFDPVTSQAGYYGTLMEGNETALVTVRL